MYIAKGKRIEIYTLTVEHVYEMRKWGEHLDPLFEDYNFPKLSRTEAKQWFHIKTGERKKKCYGVLNENGRVIGYLTISNIKRIKRNAVLGIVLDPNYLNNGYGTETLKAFLDYYFNELKMKKMYLNVARFNKRAIRCYEKCGFEIAKEFSEKLENQNIPIFSDEFYKDIRYDFTLEEGEIYCYYYKMQLDKSKYNLIFNKNMV
ncbi:GNAT family N-acetyltransferase [Thermohalobacter berrensis]|uniref:GNAT family N-acetyltransferase n=1 Tax=Thermohalobacter berrensis TaxID=99594 RepID=A0A419T3X7_9FIRM|nr:GNAT family N-acetyltransferase [Thermohalobacter berrensis]RKD32088.1 GNAT family N-acetyltransferase [Thermohalobacter berrensis]